MANATNPLPFLKTCTAAQLKLMATLTGTPSSGTKPVLTARLTAALQTPKHPPHARILSIDMGIRNLAYAQLALAANPTPTAPSPLLPTVQAWERLSLTPSPPAPCPPPPPSEAPAAAAAPKEDFTPAALASHAYAFLRPLVLASPHGAPTTVLIERQRFRSMGGAAVQEWTLRVNMLEAMMWAVLGTLRAEGRWAGAVWAVPPGRVADFWAVRDGGGGGGGGGGPGPKAKMAGQKGKEAKVGIVREWVRDGRAVALASGADAAAARFRASRGAGKLDDLADCLLQGVAWVEWEGNRRRILKGGLDALAELGGG
jgi:cruciform cutting endonuclease 1